MKTKVLFLLTIIAVSIASCGDGPDEKVLFKDTEKFIKETSKDAISLVDIKVDNKNYETVVNYETLNYSFTGTITFNNDCYLNWNDGKKPIFVPVYIKPTHSDSSKFKFHKIGDKVAYKGNTTYMKKKDVWDLFSM